MANNILIIKLGAFGDIISNVGAIQDIREHHPSAKIFLLTTPAYKKIMDKCPWLDFVITTERKPLWRIDIIHKLKRDVSLLNIDMVYDLQCSNRTNLYYKYLFRNLNWCGLANGCSHQIEKLPFLHEGKTQIERILIRDNIPANNTLKPNITWMANPNETLFIEHSLNNKKFAILFFSCAADNNKKRWPYYKELAQYLIKENISPVYLPGPDEIEAAKTLPGKLIVHKNGKALSLFEVAGFCKKANFIIGNDTGPTHMAAFLQAKGLALFGGHPSNMTYFLDGSTFSYFKKENIDQITLKEVTDHIHDYLL